MAKKENRGKRGSTKSDKTSYFYLSDSMKPYFNHMDTIRLPFGWNAAKTEPSSLEIRQWISSDLRFFGCKSVQINDETNDVFVKFQSYDMFKMVLRTLGSTIEYKFSDGTRKVIPVISEPYDRKAFRILDLPPEIPIEDIVAALSHYGKVTSIYEEAYRGPGKTFPVLTGDRLVEMYTVDEFSSVTVAGLTGRVLRCHDPLIVEELKRARFANSLETFWCKPPFSELFEPSFGPSGIYQDIMNRMHDISVNQRTSVNSMHFVDQDGRIWTYSEKSNLRCGPNEECGNQAPFVQRSSENICEMPATPSSLPVPTSSPNGESAEIRVDHRTEPNDFRARIFIDDETETVSGDPVDAMLEEARNLIREVFSGDELPTSNALDGETGHRTQMDSGAGTKKIDSNIMAERNQLATEINSANKTEECKGKEKAEEKMHNFFIEMTDLIHSASTHVIPVSKSTNSRYTTASVDGNTVTEVNTEVSRADANIRLLKYAKKAIAALSNQLDVNEDNGTKEDQRCNEELDILSNMVNSATLRDEDLWKKKRGLGVTDEDIYFNDCDVIQLRSRIIEDSNQQRNRKCENGHSLAERLHDLAARLLTQNESGEGIVLNLQKTISKTPRNSAGLEDNKKQTSERLEKSKCNVADEELNCFDGTNFATTLNDVLHQLRSHLKTVSNLVASLEYLVEKQHLISDKQASSEFNGKNERTANVTDRRCTAKVCEDTESKACFTCGHFSDKVHNGTLTQTVDDQRCLQSAQTVKQGSSLLNPAKNIVEHSGTAQPPTEPAAELEFRSNLETSQKRILSPNAENVDTVLQSGNSQERVSPDKAGVTADASCVRKNETTNLNTAMKPHDATEELEDLQTENVLNVCSLNHKRSAAELENKSRVDSVKENEEAGFVFVNCDGTSQSISAGGQGTTIGTNVKKEQASVETPISSDEKADRPVVACVRDEETAECTDADCTGVPTRHPIIAVRRAASKPSVASKKSPSFNC